MTFTFDEIVCYIDSVLDDMPVNMGRKEMKVLYVLIVSLAVMVLAAGDGLEAQEWSEPIQLVEVDVDDLCMDSDLFFAKNSDGNFHILWCTWHGIDYYTCFNQESEVILGGIELEDFPVTTGLDITNIIIDSEGDAIIGGSGWVREYEEFCVYYQRYNDEMELQGRTHRLDNTPGIHHNCNMLIIEGDTLMFIWRRGHNMNSYLNFSKVCPDDKIVINEEHLLPRDNWRGIGRGPVTVDNNGNMIIGVFAAGFDMLYVRKYNSALEELFQTTIGPVVGSEWDLFTDVENRIHLFGGFRFRFTYLYITA